MNKKIKKDDLHGEWVHSVEEDSADEAVFRQSSYDFPLTRQPRESFELKPDGKLVKGEGTAADSVSEEKGEWKLEGGDKIAFNTESAEPNETRQIKSIEDGKLVLKK